MSDLEDQFESQLANHDRMPAWCRELVFAKPRRFRFDFAWPAVKLAVEIEGGTWNGGRHTTGAGFKSDCEKYNLAVLKGWRVLRFTRDSVVDGSGVEQVLAILADRVKPAQLFVPGLGTVVIPITAFQTNHETEPA